MARAHRRAKHRAIEHTEFLFGQLTAAVYNTGFRYAVEWKVPRDYMPSQQEVRAEVDAELAVERIRCTMASFAAFQNARVARSRGA